MATSHDPNQHALCKLCKILTGAIIESDFVMHDDPVWKDSEQSPLWRPFYSWKSAFYHSTWAEVQRSADICSLCQLFAHDMAHENAQDTWQLVVVPVFGGQPIRLVTRFQEKYGAGLFGMGKAHHKWTPHVFHIVARRPYDAARGVHKAGAECQEATEERRLWNYGRSGDNSHRWVGKLFHRAIPHSADDPDVFDTARYWLQDCCQTHAECSRRPSSLPTRVIDIGTSEDNVPRLYVTQRENEPYVALSHCWGGDIPGKLLDALMYIYEAGLPMNQLPQNFLDAIRVTRELGLRYLWIDALCIIQDSAEDWKAEASKMASLYSPALVTVSVLDASKSTDGFLKPRRRKHANISPDYAVCEERLTVVDMLDQAPLESRGWCMQERFLSPTILHFSQDQIFWECRHGVMTEEGGQADFNSYRRRSTFFGDASKSDFALLRQSTQVPGFPAWYGIVEEYSNRNLTFGSDKFAALAGAAHLFLSADMGAYVTGLWSKGIATGLFWGPRAMPPVGLAPTMQDVHTLTKSSGESPAPSWSWASVNGPVEFPFKNLPKEKWLDPDVLQVLKVNITQGHDDLSPTHVEGSLRMRAPLLRMRYVPGTGNLGTLHDSIDPSNAPCMWAVMDLDRRSERECWYMVPSLPPKRHEFLLLEQESEGCFRRVGYGEKVAGQWVKAHLDRFVLTEFNFV